MSQINRRQAKLINYFNRADDFFPFREWPEWIQRWILQGQLKGNTMRYKVFCFFSYNGLDPTTTMQYMLLWGWSLTGVMLAPRLGDREPKVMRHLAQMRKQALQGTLLREGVVMYDIAARKAKANVSGIAPKTW